MASKVVRHRFLYPRCGSSTGGTLYSIVSGSFTPDYRSPLLLNVFSAGDPKAGHAQDIDEDTVFETWSTLLRLSLLCSIPSPLASIFPCQPFDEFREVSMRSADGR